MDLGLRRKLALVSGSTAGIGYAIAEALVKEGKASAVRDYLDHLAVGGFA